MFFYKPLAHNMVSCYIDTVDKVHVQPETHAVEEKAAWCLYYILKIIKPPPVFDLNILA